MLSTVNENDPLEFSNLSFKSKGELNNELRGTRYLIPNEEI